ncbi:3-phenylpropionate/trans-cinnamate dioxygenase ferredoxin subunit [Amycolatopsis sacchari]|uniref:3-phenylpropionate/trans-cinnamate dioxygenase ferredoxin subunit n=1 Tax=Amycolatopsis sacchari TaxID=115433 RepID=A0A1I3VSN3_9PSEU|nr:Rieske (2Fe-2S) protein [Amycolatopsis sacchari]SFJ97297.1 3-phenylpropionate/trans-cinnamate dioxygenase ferredoxin subunit [Amycolatopsis sacchari]
MKIVVAKVSEFPPGDRRIVQVGKRSIGVFRIGERFYALNNYCPHQGGPLCLGRTAPTTSSSRPGEYTVNEDVFVACPWHGWEYDVTTGQSYLGPGETPVRSYGVSVAPGEALGGDVKFPDRVPGPYVAETFEVHVEDDYVVVDTTARQAVR